MVCAATLPTLLGSDEYLAGFVGPIFVSLMLPVPMTSSDLHYESDGSRSVASLDLQQLFLGANIPPKSFADVYHIRQLLLEAKDNEDTFD